jgi:hypothetical protein
MTKRATAVADAIKKPRLTLSDLRLRHPLNAKVPDNPPIKPREWLMPKSGHGSKADVLRANLLRPTAQAPVSRAVKEKAEQLMSANKRLKRKCETIVELSQENRSLKRKCAALEAEFEKILAYLHATHSP